MFKPNERDIKNIVCRLRVFINACDVSMDLVEVVAFWLQRIQANNFEPTVIIFLKKFLLEFSCYCFPGLRMLRQTKSANTVINASVRKLRHIARS